MALRVESIRNPMELLELRGEWDELLSRAGDAPPFSAYGWVAPWTRLLGQGALQVFCVREGSRLIGLLPLLSRRHARLPVISYYLAASGPNGLSDQRDLLAERGREGDVAAALAAAL